VDYNNPRWHRLDDPMMEAYKAINNDERPEENSLD
jgi:hypothetical protein